MLIVTKPLHKQSKKFLVGFSFLIAFLTVAPSSSLASTDTTDEKNSTPSSGQVLTPGVVTPNTETTEQPSSSSSPLPSETENQSPPLQEPLIDDQPAFERPSPVAQGESSFVGNLVLFISALVAIALVGYFVYEKIARGPSKALQGNKTTNRTSEPIKTTTVFPSSKPIPQVGQTKIEEQGKTGEPPKIPELVKPTEPVATTESAKKPQPAPITAKVERPVLATTNASSTLDTQQKSETETKPNDNSLERLIIQPPQIGEPSSFARHDWWDKDREWCQVSPLGMSSDVVCDIGTFGSVAIAAASLRGHKHKVSGEPCQDAFSLRTTQSLSGQKYVVAVLCDGMSSAKHSEYGARRTSQLLAWSLAEKIKREDEITEQLIKAVLPPIFDYCKEQLVSIKRNEFGAPGVSPDEVVESDFFTTVTFMIVPASSGEGEILEAIVGSIGDSAVFVLNNSTTLWDEIAAVDSSSEILNPATSAFPATFDARISTIFVNKSDLVIATSDGVGNFIKVRGNQTSLGTYLAKQWGKPVNLPTFINDVGFDLKSADDDRTVIAIWLSRS
jgi:hypothetical protein